jgi:hypothetical protein
MGTPVSGQDGKISVGGVDLVLINKWDADIDAATIETTNFDSSGYREYGVVGLKSGTGNCDGLLDATAGALAVGQSVAVKLYLATSSYIGGTAIITKVKVTNDAKEFVGVSYSFQLTGVITEATGAIS